MAKEINYHIALVIKTAGLEYDDRVRKEILSVQSLFPNVSFKIIVVLNKNKEEEGVTDYGVPYKSLYLPSRDKYPSGKKLFLKMWEFYRVAKSEFKSFDAIWAADPDTFLIPLLYRGKPMLWDLHELPLPFMRNTVTKMLLRKAFSRCRVVVHANSARIDYLEQNGLIAKRSKHYALRNYPNFEDVDRLYDERFELFKLWRSNGPCVYLQSLMGKDRAAYESISAILETPGLKAVVTGAFDEDIKKRLIREYGESFNERLFFTGLMPQLKLPQYVNECSFTLIFYKWKSANNKYCEANRLYQSILLGLPVIVGNNPPMKELVEEYSFGVALEDDGNSVDLMKKAIKKVMSNYNLFKENVLINRDKVIWSNQNETITTIVETLLGNK